MLGKTHAVIGFTVGAAVAAHFHIPVNGALAIPLVAAVVGALLPDIDHHNSTISRRMWFIVFLLPLRHRGFTHSLLCLGVLYALFAWQGVDPVLTTAFIGGYASHLFADALTWQGIQLWFPMPGRVCFLPGALALTTGGLMELLIAAASGMTTALILWGGMA